MTEEIEGGVSWDRELADHLRHVGEHLMAWAQARCAPDGLKPNEWRLAGERAFGYGNHGALVTTTDSMPTATVTALWCPGVVEGRPWMPLPLRRNKLRHFVLA